MLGELPLRDDSVIQDGLEITLRDAQFPAVGIREDPGKQDGFRRIHRGPDQADRRHRHFPVAGNLDGVLREFYMSLPFAVGHLHIESLLEGHRSKREPECDCFVRRGAQGDRLRAGERDSGGCLAAHFELRDTIRRHFHLGLAGNRLLKAAIQRDRRHFDVFPVQFQHEITASVAEKEMVVLRRRHHRVRAESERILPIHLIVR